MKKSYLLGSFASISMLAAASGATLFGVTTDNRLVSFDTSAPSTFITSASISGLVSSDGVTPNPSGSILNLVARPGATSGDFQFYGIDNSANIYQINRGGAASLLSSSFSPTGFNSGLAYDSFGDDFIYAGDNAESFSLSLTGVATANPNFTYAGGGTPAIFGLGIDPDFAAAFAIDATNDSLSTSIDPNFPGNSELTIVGGLGIDVAAFGGLVVDWDGELYASLSTDGNTSELHSINPTTGVATLLGSFGPGVGLTSIAVPEPSAALLGSLGVLALLRRRRL